METNEMMENEEVAEAAEEIITKTISNQVLKTAAGIGVTATVGVLAYKFIVKPTIARIKAKKEMEQKVTDFCDAVSDEEFDEEMVFD